MLFPSLLHSAIARISPSDILQWYNSSSHNEVIFLPDKLNENESSFTFLALYAAGKVGGAEKSISLRHSSPLISILYCFFFFFLREATKSRPRGDNEENSARRIL